MPRILYVEDDPNLGFVTKDNLELNHYEIVHCVDGQEALDTFYQQQPFDMCVLDVMLPKLDGFTLAQRIRQQDRHVPILFLTARSLQEDKLHGLRIGGDDYLTKPFSMEELLMRMQAILRRVNERTSSEIRNNVYVIGKYQFDFNRQILRIADKEQKLTSKEAALLRLLAINLNQVLDRSYALKEIWNDDSYFNARSMDVYITKLRKFLKLDPTVELINVHGIGFKLVTNN